MLKKKQLPIQTVIISFLLLCVAALSINSCKKTDTLFQSNNETPKERTAENFFKLPANAPSVLKRIAKELERQNKTNEFVQAFIAKEGFPIWNKSRMETHKRKHNVSTFGDGDDLNDTIVYIPLVVDSQHYVHGFLKATVTDTVDIRIFRQNDYLSFPFETSTPTTSATTAEDYAIRMMSMDRDVFGNTEFKMADKRMFHISTDYSDTATTQRFVKLTDSTGIGGDDTGFGFAGGGTGNYQEQICYEVWVYTSNCGTSFSGTINNMACTGSWHSENYCVIFESGGSGWPAPPGGGPGGSGGGTNPSCLPGGENIVNGFVPIECAPGPGGNPWPSRDENGFLYSRITELQSQITADATILEPCDSLTLMNLATYGPMYQRIAQFTASGTVTNRLDSIRQAQGTNWSPDNYSIQSLTDAYGPVVNCDYFPLRITQFPNHINTSTPMTPAEFLEYFRLNINSFITSPVTVNFSCNLTPQFDDCQKWNQASGNALGSLNHVFIPGNSGSVILSDYQHINSTAEQHYFKVSTLETPFDGEHPVAGNREFGLFNTSDSLARYTFYTMAVDRTWDWLTNAMNNTFGGFRRADSLWTNIQGNLKNFVNNNGGTASYYQQRNYIARPKWDDVKDFLKGIISFATLRQRLGC